MTYPNVIVTIIPLIISLVGITFYEFKTGLILDKVTLPAAVYFVLTSSLFGPGPAYQYPLTLAATFVALLGIRYLCEYFLNTEIIGGGAIKLLTAIAGAVGTTLALAVVMLFLIAVAGGFVITAAFGRYLVIPSSPILLVIVCGVLTYYFSVS
jgi:hypothetical protein